MGGKAELVVIDVMVCLCPCEAPMRRPPGSRPRRLISVRPGDVLGRLGRPRIPRVYSPEECCGIVHLGAVEDRVVLLLSIDRWWSRFGEGMDGILLARFSWRWGMAAVLITRL